MSNQEWHKLSRFESYDLAKSWYQQTHQRQMNAAKAKQINACFIQGREYFKSASSSDMSVKPLLLYYGVLSLARGAILLRNASKKGESLAPSHGLKEVNWRKTVSGGLRDILDLGIQAKGGTFLELVESIPNVHQTHYFSHQSKSKAVLQHNLGDVEFCTTQQILTLGDLLSRLKQTMHSFQGVTSKDPKWFLTIVTTYVAETHFLLFTKPPDEVLKLVDQRSVTIQPMPQKWPNLTTPIPQHGLVFRHRADAAHQSKFPLFHDTEGSQGLMYGIADFPNGDKLIEFFKLYLISFILGTLARYYPSEWMALLAGSPGDFSRPLIFQAIEAIESEFPAELSKQVSEHPQVLGSQAWYVSGDQGDPPTQASG